MINFSTDLIKRFLEETCYMDLDNKKIQVLIFEEDDKGETKIRKADFDSEGDLVNWPTGFFSGVMLNVYISRK